MRFNFQYKNEPDTGSNFFPLGGTSGSQSLQSFSSAKPLKSPEISADTEQYRENRRRAGTELQ
jgi:hypothetical protein